MIEPQEAATTETIEIPERNGRTSVSLSAASSRLLDELVADANVIRVRDHKRPTTKRQALDAILKAVSKESALHTLTIH